MRARIKHFDKEADLVSSFVAAIGQNPSVKDEWTIYPESCGWDLLLVHKKGYQVGLEAKLSLNAKALAQALEGTARHWSVNGPDYRGVLVPAGAAQNHMRPIARALGIEVIEHQPDRRYGWHLELPDQDCNYTADRWPCWLPEKRCALPEYVPDVQAGVSSPVQLTHWKIKAIKLMIVLERRGYVTRGDMRAIGINAQRWTAGHVGFLDKSDKGYVAGERTPNLRVAHPTNYAEIEADADRWLAELGIGDLAPVGLFAETPA